MSMGKNLTVQLEDRVCVIPLQLSFDQRAFRVTELIAQPQSSVQNAQIHIVASAKVQLIDSRLEQKMTGAKTVMAQQPPVVQRQRQAL